MLLTALSPWSICAPHGFRYILQQNITCISYICPSIPQHDGVPLGAALEVASLLHRIPFHIGFIQLTQTCFTTKGWAGTDWPSPLLQAVVSLAKVHIYFSTQTSFIVRDTGRMYWYIFPGSLRSVFRSYWINLANYFLGSAKVKY